MFRWIPFAMVRITLFFVAGILVAIHYAEAESFSSAASWMVILTVVYFFCTFLFKDHSSIKLISGMIGLASIGLAGFLNVVIKTESWQANHLSKFEGPIDYYLAEVKNLPEERTNYSRLEIELIAAKRGQEWNQLHGKTLLYFDRKKGQMDFRYGDLILVKGNPILVDSPSNPGEFDFKKYLFYKNILFQHTLTLQQVIKVRDGNYHSVSFYSQAVRGWASDKLDHYVSGQREQAIAKALVLGVTDGLDNDLRDAYAASGAMHILSVSGLHVGVIYAVILFLLRPFSRFSWSRWLVAILGLTCLWAYAFVTGLSPSVLRAVAMFSFIALGKPLARDANVYNTLAASGFLLLIYDPYLIMSVGFQLSYAAVLGIIYLYRPLYNSWEPKGWLADKIWQVTSVSIAAQLATVAMGLYYFHQFPVYFLFSNLIVVPLSSLILLMGVGLLCISGIPFIATGLGCLLHVTIYCLNSIVFFIERLPYSLIGGVQISPFQCWLIIGILIATIGLIASRKFKWLALAFVLALGFSWIEFDTYQMVSRQEKLVVYKIQRRGVLEWFIGNRSYVYSDSALMDETTTRHIEPNRLLSGIRETQDQLINNGLERDFGGFRLFCFRFKTVLWVDRRDAVLPKNIKVDYLVIGHDAIRSWEALRGKVSFRKLILDSSNSRTYATRWTKDMRLRGISVHSVLGEGAIVINF